MDNLLIDVVIGLVLIYIAMAMLLMRLQESLHGGLLRGRVKNMHLMLHEAVGQDEGLKKRVLENPLLSSLSKDNQPAAMGRFMRPPTGPSSVPPDLFVKALLMTLNPSGQLPSSEKLLPLAFMDNLLKNEAPDTPRAKYLNGMRALIPAKESGWPAFETAIATWFSDIGDRADGWYKRRSSMVGFWLAVGLCAALNVDTNNIVNTLGADNELRQGLGNLAELVLQQRAGEDKTVAAPAPADPTVDPAVRAVSRLVDANAHVSEAYFKDKAITRFGYYMTDVAKVCPQVTLPEPAKAKEGTFVSNSDTWVSILPALLPDLEHAIHHVDDDVDVPLELRKAYTCLSHVSAWVRAASTASNSNDTRRVMLEAGKALEESKSAILTVLRSNQQQGGLRRLFRMDPEAFERCAAASNASTANMKACVLRDQDLLNRLPLGHTGSNWRQQFCEVQPLSADAGAAAAPASSLSKFACSGVVLAAQPRLDTGGMALSFNPLGLLWWFTGIFISALFISLGAPILFDVLGRWVKLKSAGEVRDAAKSAASGGGTLALPMLAPSDDGRASGAGITAVPGAGTLPAVEGADAGFEERLTPREVQALKQRLGIQPSTGGFDDATRTAIGNITGSKRLTLASYAQLMGRPPVQAGQLVGALPSSRALLRQPFGMASSLADNLNVKLALPSRVATSETTFSDELRAMTVLYRFKSDTNSSVGAPIFKLANEHPEQLDQVDEALLNKMLDASTPPFTRFAGAPWMDVALGELGQVERNGSSRATSNPRICEYLDAVRPKLGDGGDTISWCGAFVTWVLKHPCSTDPKATAPVVPAAIQPAPPSTWLDLNNGLRIPRSSPETALSWQRWERPNAAAGTVAGPSGQPQPMAGDVVVVDNGEGGHHVGFVFHVNSATGEFWMLGGNQRGGTRVCLSRWLLTSIR